MDSDQKTGVEEQPASKPDASQPVVAGQADDLREFLTFVKKYLPSMLWAGVLALVVVLGVRFYKYRVRTGNETVLQQLYAVAQIADLEKTAKRYPSAPAAPLLLLRIAKSYYVAGNNAMALSKYDEFLARFPNHIMSGTAEMGRAQCLEAMGRYDEAMQRYASFLGTSTNHYLAVHAVLGKGRCLERLGRRDEARTMYEDFLAADPENPWEFLLNEALVRTKEAPAWSDMPAATNQFFIPQPVPSPAAIR